MPEAERSRFPHYCLNEFQNMNFVTMGMRKIAENTLFFLILLDLKDGIISQIPFAGYIFHIEPTGIG